MSSITLASIFMNEAENLEKIQNSFMDVFDEWLIIDLGSQDITSFKAAWQGAKVYTFASGHHVGGFGNARTLLLHLCHTDYCFFLDGDERLLKEDIQWLKALADLNVWDVVWLPRINYANWDMSISIPSGVRDPDDFQCRLIKCDRRIFFSGKVHERIHWTQNVKWDLDTPVIRHFGPLRSNARKTQVGNNYNSLEQNRPELWSNVVVPYWQEGRSGIV